MIEFIQKNNFYLSSNHPDERPNDEEDKSKTQAAETNHLKVFNFQCHLDDILHSIQLFNKIYNSLKSFNFW